MNTGELIKTIGSIAAFILPLWNIPLIIRINRRRSSKDVSLWWAYGVLISFLFMLPAGLITEDIVFKTFSITNFILFSAVVFQVTRYR